MENDKEIISQHSDYQQLISNISLLIEDARTHVAKEINTTMVETYWHIGQYIVEYEQGGETRAQYGKKVLDMLSRDLTSMYGRGFGRSNVFAFRQFYISYPKIQTLSGQLSWSHYIELLKCGDSMERGFYEKQCIKDKWSCRELKRGEIQHEDIGQMNLYLNYFKKEVCQLDDNQPIGIVLGASKNDIVMQYAMEDISNQLFAAKYQLYMPKREELQKRLDFFLEETDKRSNEKEE